MNSLPEKQAGAKQRRRDGAVAHHGYMQRPDNRLFSTPLVCHCGHCSFPALAVYCCITSRAALYLSLRTIVMASVIHAGETFSPRMRGLMRFTSNIRVATNSVKTASPWG